MTGIRWLPHDWNGGEAPASEPDRFVGAELCSILRTIARQRDTMTLAGRTLELMDRYWRAANYVSVGQIYLLDNPLLKEPLAAEHVKPRLLGHWGTTPGLNFLYVHLNRIIRERGQDVLYVCGPGHGGPAMVANTWLEGSYSEVYPEIGQDEQGLRKLFKQFSFPGGVPSHVAPETPGSIHEGGELGYALVHAYGAAFDNPDLIVACVVGDGEAETGPLAAAWHSNKFLNPKVDGAVLPILHLNGYKIANPTLLARMDDAELRDLFSGYGYAPFFVEGHEPFPMHEAMAATFDAVFDRIGEIQRAARVPGATVTRPRWPMIVLRSPKGWTGPKEVDGKKVEDFWRSHQVPVANARGAYRRCSATSPTATRTSAATLARPSRSERVARSISWMTWGSVVAVDSTAPDSG